LKKIYHILSFTALITGTALGGGILGLPVLAGTAGFLPSILCLFFVFVFMTAASLLIVYTFDNSRATDFASLHNEKLSPFLKNLHAVVFLVTLYMLLVAYLSGITSVILYLLPQLKSVPYHTQITTIAFFLFGTALVIYGGKFMRKSNSFFIIFMFIAFIVLVLLTFKYIKPNNLQYTEWKQFPFVMPILVTAFGFQVVIPVLYQHSLGMHSRKMILYSSLVLGSLLILVINLIWIIVVLGIVPVHSTGGGGVSIYYALKHGIPITVPLSKIANSPLLLTFAMLFTFFAIVTSYVGVGASLLNYIEGLTKNYIKLSRFKCILLTFGLPLIFVFTYPQIFIKALSFVGGFGIIIISCIIPAIIGLKFKNYFVKYISCFVLLVSVIILVAEVILFF
jgi:tyrosine-specific transport protein